MIINRVYFKIQWWKDGGVWIDLPDVIWETYSEAVSALVDIDSEAIYDELRVVKVTEEINREDV
jgi:hypothetical protein